MSGFVPTSYGERDPRARCPYCSYHTDQATELGEHHHTPAEGDVSLCMRCGRLALFTGDGLRTRRPSRDERAELLTSREVQMSVKAWREWVDETGGVR